MAKPRALDAFGVWTFDKFVLSDLSFYQNILIIKSLAPVA